MSSFVDVALFLGTYLLHRSRRVILVSMETVIGASAVLSAAMIVAMELWTRWTKCKGKIIDFMIQLLLSIFIKILNFIGSSQMLFSFL